MSRAIRAISTCVASSDVPSGAWTLTWNSDESSSGMKFLWTVLNSIGSVAMQPTTASTTIQRCRSENRSTTR